MDRHFRDRKLKLLLTADSPHWGSPPGRVSHVFDSILRVSLLPRQLLGLIRAAARKAFADELARTFEEHGGHVLSERRGAAHLAGRGRRGARSSNWRFCAGRCRGLVRVRAGAVVSLNSDMMDTMTRLVGRGKHCPPGLLDGWSRLRRSCFLLHHSSRPPGRLRR